MATRTRKLYRGRFLEDIPEEIVQPQITKPDSEDTPRSRTLQPNLPEFLSQQAGSLQPSRIQTSRPIASESSSTIPSSTFRKSSTTAFSQAPSEIPFKWDNPHPFGVQNENHSVREIPVSPECPRQSKRQRICYIFRDIWIEIESRIKCENKLERNARKAREVRRRESIANTAVALAGMEAQLKNHKEREEKRNSDALARAKENEIEAKAKEERRKAAVKRSKGKEKKERKEEKKREKENRRSTSN
ncbi:59e72c53-a6ea-4665-a406-b6af45cb53f8 [Sclerotinia trifoliorum]|uniref:59e72c53-a6ea-4665-a406-b6af45cb53f8 n=1 Tax=Sclerotinia trifoliorum TaxID=28548 RepID=A0A8H2ZRQ0_9HELO|nr:59e72c53-a6ea-4665-a406-b6af45cb53f8 [Sclerotinia trifoliorum]